MALLDTLCGLMDVHNTSVIYLIGSGLTPNFTYHLSTATANPAFDTNVQAKATDDQGVVIFQLNRPGVTVTYYLHDQADAIPPNAEHRATNPVTLKWRPDGPPAVYVSSNPVLTGKAKNSRARLSWTPPTACDPRAIFNYTVRRNGAVVASALTTLAYDDEPLTNGTSYTWFVRARFFIINFNAANDTGQNFDSNNVSVIPRVIESWGIVAA